MTIEILIRELANYDFKYIIVESLYNNIEDINCVYSDKIDFIQIKKREHSVWSRNDIEPIIHHLYSLFKEPKEKLTELNIPICFNYEFKYLFITNADFSPEISKFNLSLRKIHNNEQLNDEEEKILILFKNKKKKYEEFLRILYLDPNHISGNPENITDHIKEMCVLQLVDKAKLKKEISTLIIQQLYEEIAEKNCGRSSSTRKIEKSNLIELIADYKCDKRSNPEYTTWVKNFLDMINEYILDIEGEILYNQFITYGIDNKSLKISIKFKIWGKDMNIIIVESKLTSHKLNEFLIFENYIKSIKNSVVLFIFTNNRNDFCGLKENNCLIIEFENVKNYFQKLKN